jgi:phthalate 4,5-cis-dihydrodiol dehydrogenase
VKPIALGAAGLGRAFMLMLPTLIGDPRIRLMAAADPREDARQQFSDDFGGRAYATVEELCADPDVEAVYLATPHQFHAEGIKAAARSGKHALVEKPMAVTLAECAEMVDAMERAGRVLVIGHSHSFDLPYLRARGMIASGVYGDVKMITALNFTDFLYRPRRPEELDTGAGGGVVFSQAAHQIDVVRLLGGGPVRTVRAVTGRWDPDRPTEGAYQAFLTFEGGASASLTYSGYAHFDTDELGGGVGEMGEAGMLEYGRARAALRHPGSEADLKATRAYGPLHASDVSGRKRLGHSHFGMVVASCERADVRPTPQGVFVYEDTRRWLDALPPPDIPRREVIDELYAAIRQGHEPLHSGRWGMATLEVCSAILESARTGKEVSLHHQRDG